MRPHRGQPHGRHRFALRRPPRRPRRRRRIHRRRGTGRRRRGPHDARVGRERADRTMHPARIRPRRDRRGPDRREFLRQPRVGAHAGRRHRHQRQDDRCPHHPAPPPRGGRALRPHRHSRDRRRVRARPRNDDHTARDRDQPQPRDDGRVRVRFGRDRGFEPRAGAAPRRRASLPGRGLHQPHGRPPGLPRLDGRVRVGQGPALRVARARIRRDRQRRRSVVRAHAPRLRRATARLRPRRRLPRRDHRDLTDRVPARVARPVGHDHLRHALDRAAQRDERPPGRYGRPRSRRRRDHDHRGPAGRAPARRAARAGRPGRRRARFRRFRTYRRRARFGTPRRAVRDARRRGALGRLRRRRRERLEQTPPHGRSRRAVCRSRRHHQRQSQARRAAPHHQPDPRRRPTTTDRRRIRVEADRTAAIHAAIDEAEPGDVVVIAGKGHESQQELPDGHGGVRIVPFDDGQVARAALRERGSPIEHDARAAP